jgi:hypothetical protein
MPVRRVPSMNLSWLLERTKNWPPLPRSDTSLTRYVRRTLQLWGVCILSVPLFALIYYLLQSVGLSVIWPLFAGLGLVVMVLLLGCIAFAAGLTAWSLIKGLSFLFSWKLAALRDALIVTLAAAVPVIVCFVVEVSAVRMLGTKATPKFESGHISTRNAE